MTNEQEDTIKVVPTELSYGTTHETIVTPSRLEIAAKIMPVLLAMPPNAGFEWAAHEALRYADELIKQSKQ